MAVEQRRTAEGLQLELSGELSMREFAELAAELERIDLSGIRRVRIGTRAVTQLDLSAAWALRSFISRAQGAGSTVDFEGAPPDQLRMIEETLKGEAPVSPPPHTHLSSKEVEVQALTYIGRYTVGAGHDLVDGLAFLGRVAVTAVRDIGSVKSLRLTSVTRHVYDTGITAVPIVALIAFLISVIIAYMSAQQLRGLGVDIYVVDLVTIGVLRELGVLLTSVIVAGRSGSAFAAEIGSMKLNEEVDALIATGVDPYEALVVPRVLGLVIALPLLTIIADLIGLLGGALLCRFLLDMPLTQYVNRVYEAISPTTFWVGLIKAPVFALLIGLAGCYRGLEVRSSARELGRLVTVAVVQAIFFVILADALFAVLFMEMNI
jgi:phospholipid/cholesterol/gamma-HCH transport system permease protein